MIQHHQLGLYTLNVHVINLDCLVYISVKCCSISHRVQQLLFMWCFWFQNLCCHLDLLIFLIFCETWVCQRFLPVIINFLLTISLRSDFFQIINVRLFNRLLYRFFFNLRLSFSCLWRSRNIRDQSLTRSWVLISHHRCQWIHRLSVVFCSPHRQRSFLFDDFVCSWITFEWSVCNSFWLVIIVCIDIFFLSFDDRPVHLFNVLSIIIDFIVLLFHFFFHVFIMIFLLFLFFNKFLIKSWSVPWSRLCWITIESSFLSKFSFLLTENILVLLLMFFKVYLVQGFILVFNLL